ncbi:MAG: RNA pseudouridine synthase [Paenibacillus sp. RIFOXYA1_FULL_44_5]|nr:MAG: RNA pseudouridine synthase [Paenibacillus sp. RIFOXYA1_FULL_44_5]
MNRNEHDEIYHQLLSYVVPQEENGWTLKTILQRRLHISRKLLSRLKQSAEGILLNGKMMYVSDKAAAGDMVEISVPQEKSEDILPQDLPINVIHEDEHLLIVNKPAGQIVHPTHGHYTHTLANAVVYYWQSRGQSFRFRPVHRLDQDTSGVLIIAKNAYAHQYIAAQMIQNTVEKQYIAFVYGIPAERIGRIDQPIDRNPADPFLRMVMPNGYEAKTRYQLMEPYKDASMIALWLETGRTHQIRVHMKHIGCPLIGDKLYVPEIQEQAALKPEADTWIERQALHAAKLSFIHPGTQERIQFTAEMPSDMLRLEEVLRERSKKTKE